MKLRALPLALVLLATACGTGTDGSSAAASPEATAPQSSPPPVGAPLSSFDGPAAPDFAVAPENRDGSFQLSAEQKPVYMVFWAEW